MKTQLIKLQNKFILVSDETIATGDYVYENISGIFGPYETGDVVENPKKIIAGIPELPSIDFSLLSEKDCKTIGWVDVEKLAIKTAKEYYHLDGDIELEHPEYILGFKTAQSLNDKNCICQQKVFNVEVKIEKNIIKVVKILGS